MSDPTPAMTILIVEDNERNLRLVRDMLQSNGYETIEAADARTVSRSPLSVGPI